MESNLISWLKKAAIFYKTVAILGLNMLLCIVVAELLAHAYLSAVTKPVEEQRAQLSYYMEQEWSQTYWQEFRLIARSYQPFTIWRRNQSSGQYINVDQNGLRITPQSDCDSGKTTIFMFGGSTMWGTGAPDSDTIPSYFLEEIERQFGKAICIVNFGESAYTSTQSLITLISELHQGNVPDFVIFYDGANDTSAVFTSAEQWTHANLPNIAKRFEPAESLPRQFIKSRKLYKVAQKLRAQNREAAIPTFTQDASTLAEYVSTTYQENYQIVDALSQKYQFDYAFFWQPIIGYSQKGLTPEEEKMVVKAKSIHISFDHERYNRIEFLHFVYAHVVPQLDRLEFAYDLSQIFEDEQRSIYIDFVHVIPEANQLLAAKMVELIQSPLSKQIDSRP